MKDTLPMYLLPLRLTAYPRVQEVTRQIVKIPNPRLAPLRHISDPTSEICSLISGNYNDFSTWQKIYIILTKLRQEEFGEIMQPLIEVNPN